MSSSLMQPPSRKPGNLLRKVQGPDNHGSFTNKPWNPVQIAAMGITDALANPYRQLSGSYAQDICNNISPHYYQAYMQCASSSRPASNAQGYTYSSTYNPGAPVAVPNSAALGNSSRDRVTLPSTQTTVHRIQSQNSGHGSWYQPGNSRCSRPGCTFSGSFKSVEIHMMDRHLIYPLGWENRKKDDWDADPSLKGKPIPIQGTGLFLNTLEAVDGWIAERKKRFPTAEKVEDKKRKLEEAIARGQLGPEDMGLPGRKKRKMENKSQGEGGAAPRGHRNRSRARGKGGKPGQLGGGASSQDPKSMNAEVKEAAAIVSSTVTNIAIESTAGIDSEGDDEAPEVVSSKISGILHQEPHDIQDPTANKSSNNNVPKPVVKKPAQQPKVPTRNPFASRPKLLRNLLLPEIRITVSNLSQAIRFLVDNDFLRNVEAKPGEASEKRIEVVSTD
ncbi:hypothetical protein BJ138DRAFT_1149494 [Hygrophoropsis aurantiaca]|uniref:Uncharacterized protein n=1 Tax=Hygrophoropsis aurantiaca TaxID=72124 RepID=A0ACB8AF75_9AGAM|nr:hypothetical protein BJ138DRAFT_1149494 [Hygrophoropsis aurantiaca]